MTRPFDDRPLLILDVDETLLHASEVPANRAADFQCGPYFGDEEDNELVLLAEYLPTLASVNDFRPIEKRGWRHSVSAESDK